MKIETYSDDIVYIRQGDKTLCEINCFFHDVKVHISNNDEIFSLEITGVWNMEILEDTIGVEVEHEDEKPHDPYVEFECPDNAWLEVEKRDNNSDRYGNVIIQKVSNGEDTQFIDNIAEVKDALDTILEYCDKFHPTKHIVRDVAYHCKRLKRQLDDKGESDEG